MDRSVLISSLALLPTPGQVQVDEILHHGHLRTLCQRVQHRGALDGFLRAAIDASSPASQLGDVKCVLVLVFTGIEDDLLT